MSSIRSSPSLAKSQQNSTQRLMVQPRGMSSVLLCSFSCCTEDVFMDLQIYAGTSFWSTPLPPRLWRQLRMQMATNLTNSIHSESTSLLTLTSKCIGSQNGYRNSHYRCVKMIKKWYFSPQVHEHQWWVGNSREAAIQRFCKYLFLVFPTLVLFFPSLKYSTAHRHFICVFREICVTGLRIQTVVTNTAWSMKLVRGRQFLIMTPRTRSQLKKEP